MSSRFLSVNPVTNQTIGAFAKQTPQEVGQQLDQNKEIFNAWKNVPLEQKAALWQKVAKILDKDAYQYAQLITAEMGKPIAQSLAEIKKSAWVCRYYAENASTFLAPYEIKTDNIKSYIAYQPLGTILQIMPWNFPFWQVFRFSAPALMAGNITLLKHAPNVLGCGEAIQAIFEEAGFPKGVFQHIIIDTTLVKDVMEHPFVQGVALTGSIGAGTAVGQLAGQNIKRFVLELGGSDAFVVLEDADLEKAAEGAVASRCNNSGQTCISAKRFIVQKSIAPAFKKLVKQKIANLKIGDPLQEDTNISAMARLDLVQTLQQQVNKSIEMGAVSEIGGGHQEGSNYFHPMLLSNIKKGMPAYEEEFFGPVFLFFEVDNKAEAIALANDTIFGLGATVWSANIEEAEAIALQLDAGAVAINKVLSSDPRIPFGGIKQSGVGRELGKAGILEFVNQKSIVI